MYFFDMHSHILPDVDDGAATQKETMKMLDMAYEEGIRYICATPHWNHSKPTDMTKASAIFHKLQADLRQIHPDMQLFLGNELLSTYGIADDLMEKRALTYNGSKYVLLEFYSGESYSDVFQAVQKLAVNGYRPVLAHVERVECLWKEWDRMDELKEMHVPFQMNTASLMGSRLNGAVRYCRKLVSEGYIDLLGTDAHNCTSRAPIYREAANWIEKACGEALLRKICWENPQLILKGQRF
jgi:protein-tyrosine phosphatase